MKEFIEKLIGRLEELKEIEKKTEQIVVMKIVVVMVNRFLMMAEVKEGLNKLIK